MLVNDWRGPARTKQSRVRSRPARGPWPISRRKKRMRSVASGPGERGSVPCAAWPCAEAVLPGSEVLALGCLPTVTSYRVSAEGRERPRRGVSEIGLKWRRNAESVRVKVTSANYDWPGHSLRGLRNRHCWRVGHPQVGIVHACLRDRPNIALLACLQRGLLLWPFAVGANVSPASSANARTRRLSDAAVLGSISVWGWLDYRPRSLTVRELCPSWRILPSATPISSHQAAYASGEISLGLISLRPPQKTFV